MGFATFRNREWTGRRWWRAVPRRIRWDAQAAMYWRRRLVALTIGLAVLALISWAFSGALGLGGGGGTAAGTGRAAKAGTGQGGHQGGVAGVGQSSPATSTSPTASPSPTATGPAACPHGSVVLSLFSAQQSYGPGELPQFSVDVVQTGRPTCTFNVGADHVVLLITRGKRRVWSSADCVQGAGDLVTDLQRGVPTVLPISWNRVPSSPGCHAEAAELRSGAYSATATDGWLASNSVTFRIS
jgi:hypothetical protein